MSIIWTDIVNVIVLLSSLFVVGGLLWLAKLTRSTGFYWKSAAFGWIALNRGLLVAGVWPFSVYSQQLALPFYLLFSVGIILTIRVLLRVYQPPQDPFRDTSNGPGA